MKRVVIMVLAAVLLVFRPSNTDAQFVVNDPIHMVVHLITLTMPGGGERFVQLAERDFPEGADEWEALEYIVEKTGAYDGEFMAITYEGYDPFSEIVRCDMIFL